MLENTMKTFILKQNIINNLQIRFLRSFPKRVQILETEEKQKWPEPDTRILKVAIIGVPNAGKSTLINSLMDRRVSAVSTRVHTTRSKIKAVCTQGDSQIVFLDTPGLVNDREIKKFNFDGPFIKGPKKSLNEAHIIGVVHDIADPHNRETLDIKIIKMLENYSKKPSFLVLNKVDLLKSKRKLLDLTKILTENHLNGEQIPGEPKKYEKRGWRHFNNIFMVSALTSDGIRELKDYLFKNTLPGKFLFPEDTFTDQTPEKIIVDTVKAVFLNFLPQELPYKAIPQMEFFKTTENGDISTVVKVKCPNARISKLIAGDADGRLRQITGAVQHNLNETFDSYVNIKIVLDPWEE